MNAAASSLLRGLDERLARGVVAGASAGLLFLLANMWYADSQNLPAVAPLYDISTIFYFTDQPDPVPENAAVGLIVHLALSAGFGVVLAVFAPLFASGRWLAAGSVIFGLLLYLVNFQILGRLVFEWFQEGPDQTFEVFAHLGYGLLLAPFMTGYVGAGEGVRVGARARPAGQRRVVT